MTTMTQAQKTTIAKLKANAAIPHDTPVTMAGDDAQILDYVFTTITIKPDGSAYVTDKTFGTMPLVFTD